MAKVDTIPVSEVLAGKMNDDGILMKYNFWIPVYQRGYRWVENQVVELIQDLYDFERNSIIDKGSYCLQPIVVKAREGGLWTVIDGQQRLTTIWLMAVLEDNIRSKSIFHMEFQNKDKLNALFADIEKMVNDKKRPDDIIAALDGRENDSIDCMYVVNNMKIIYNYQYNGLFSDTILNEIFNKNRQDKNIDFIWYELEEGVPEDKEISTFTNINANKIKLTNAELIKASVLHSLSFEKRNLVVVQWENIEKKLNDQSFWGFLMDLKKDKYETRIDLIFDLWYSSKSFEPGQYDDEIKVFRKVAELIKLDNENAERIWLKCTEIYETLLDWYQDYSNRHLIGLLSSVKGSEIRVISAIFQEYTKVNATKDIFRKWIKSEIFKEYFSDEDEAKKKCFSRLDQDAIITCLNNLNYGDERVEKVLLLYNIALLLNAQNVYETFPFELFKSKEITWDIEHVNPRTPKDNAPKDDTIQWIESYRKHIEGKKEHKELIKKIDKELMNISKTYNAPTIEALCGEIAIALNVAENNDNIRNLVLLDSVTNRSYKNESFSDKRKVIIETERTNKRKDSSANKAVFIPVGTKWVFLKGYEKANQLAVWNATDMDEYVDDIAIQICSLLQEIKING